jgi:hypothetical protein
MSSLSTPMDINPPVAESKRIRELVVKVAVYEASAATQQAYVDELKVKSRIYRSSTTSRRAS